MGSICRCIWIGGGWFAGLLIIGTMWFLNHELGLINNDGAFVDMAAGIGLFAASVASGDSFRKGLTNYIVSLIGGTLGALFYLALCNKGVILKTINIK